MRFAAAVEFQKHVAIERFYRERCKCGISAVSRITAMWEVFLSRKTRGDREGAILILRESIRRVRTARTPLGYPNEEMIAEALAELQIPDPGPPRKRRVSKGRGAVRG